MVGRHKRKFSEIKRQLIIEVDNEEHILNEELSIRCPICNSTNISTNGTQKRYIGRVELFKCKNKDCEFKKNHNYSKQFILTTSKSFKKISTYYFSKIIEKIAKGTSTKCEIARDFNVSESLISKISEIFINNLVNNYDLDQLILEKEYENAIAIDETFAKINGKSVYLLMATGYSNHKVLAIRVSYTRKEEDLKKLFEIAEKNIKGKIDVVIADAWGATQAMVVNLNREMTLIIHRHKKPYKKAHIWQIQYKDNDRIITKIGIKTDIFKKKAKREYRYLVETKCLTPKAKKKRGRPKGVKNKQRKKQNNNNKPKPKRGRKGFNTVFKKGTRGYVKVDPYRKQVKFKKDVLPAVRAAFGNTINLFSKKFIQNNLAEYKNSVLSSHLKLSGPHSLKSLENQIKAFFLIYNNPGLLEEIELSHRFNKKFLYRQIRESPLIEVLSGVIF